MNKTIKAWLNVYPTRAKRPGHSGGIYETREEADHQAKNHRVACIPIAWDQPSDVMPRGRRKRPQTFIQAMGHGLYYAYYFNNGADEDFTSEEAAQAWIDRCQKAGRWVR